MVKTDMDRLDLLTLALMDTIMLSNYCLIIQKAKALISRDKIIVDGLQAN
mgnify:CR=1 FL=1